MTFITNFQISSKYNNLQYKYRQKKPCLNSKVYNYLILS